MSKGTAPFTPISSKDPQIRILTVLPSDSSSAPIQTIRSTVSLSSRPSYFALSYVWGAPVFTSTILIDSHPHPVTQTLYFALKRLRQRADEIHVWVDALCINQDDLVEKSQQIPLMGTIYSQAKEVVAWLGEPRCPEEELYAAQSNSFLEKYADIMRRNYSDRSARFPLATAKQIFADAFEVSDALRHFLGLAYWERLWIVQEFVLAARMPKLQFGKHVLNDAIMFLEFLIEDIHDKFRLLETTHPNDEKIYADVLPAARNRVSCHCTLRDEYSNTRRSRLWGILYLTTGLKSTVPVDCIFALYGLINQEDYPAPDYMKPVAQVYWETMCVMLREEGSFGTLCDRFTPRTSVEYPSWVPDIKQTKLVPPACSDERLCLTRQQSVWHRFPSMAVSHPCLSPDSKILFVRGFIVGTIKAVLDIPVGTFATDTKIQLQDFLVEWAFQLIESGVCNSVHPSADLNGSEHIPLPTQLQLELWECIRLRNPGFWLIGLRRMLDLVAQFEQDPTLVCERHCSRIKGLRGTQPQCLATASSLYEAAGGDTAHELGSTAIDEGALNSGIKMFITESGFLGQTHAGVELGDAVTILNIGNLPFVLKPTGGETPFHVTEQDFEEKRRLYSMVGLAHVSGIMEGEYTVAVENLRPGENHQEDIAIC